MKLLVTRVMGVSVRVAARNRMSLIMLGQASASTHILKARGLPIGVAKVAAMRHQVVM